MRVEVYKTYMMRVATTVTQLRALTDQAAKDNDISAAEMTELMELREEKILLLMKQARKNI